MNNSSEVDIELLQKRLNEVSDKLNLRIQQEELFFKNMNLGVQAWIHIGSKKEFKIGYTNEDGDWGIYLLKINENPERKWLLKAAPRGLRLYGLKHIPELRLAVIHTAESLTNRIEKYLIGQVEIEDDE